MTRTRFVAALSLLFTALFFIEYTPALPRTRIPYDLEGFHYPLADYAFQALKQHRFPQWDPTIYSGLSFTDNAQTAMYYPPLWLLFALKWGSAKLSYRALEYLALAHVWLAFLLCYGWLHGRRKLHWLASILGAGCFAFGGYLVEQLQHLGLLAGYAWLPLAFSSIDEAAEKGQWRPLWKLALASSMCLLGGYPPVCVVFAVCAAAYAFARAFARAQSRAGLGLWVLAALACSLLFCAVELLPALEAARLKIPELKYSAASGFTRHEFYLSYFVPNYFKFDLGVDPSTTEFRDYLYLGGAGIAGLLLFFRRRRFRDAAPLLAVLLASLLFLTNPGSLLGRLIQGTPLAQVTVDWDFLAGVSAALAALAAIGLDHALRGTGRKAPAWSILAAIGLAAAWAIRLIVLWNGPGVASGAKSAWDALGATVLCGALIYVYSRAERPLRAAVAAALLLLAAADYKAFGTSKQFNGYPEKDFHNITAEKFPGMNADIYAELQRHREYRWAVEDYGPSPVDLRHAGFNTPQGFDPGLPAHYKKLIDGIGGQFETNRLFNLNPSDVASLRLLGVGYFVVADRSPDYAELLKSPSFRLMQPDDSYYKVFQLLDAQPPFGWEQPEADRFAAVTEWRPERRGFRVKPGNGGVFRLSEQFYPGWSATVDGAEVQIQRCHEAFQCVPVGPGEHLLEFRYRARWLLPGAALSLSSMLLAMVLARVRLPALSLPRLAAPRLAAAIRDGWFAAAGWIAAKTRLVPLKSMRVAVAALLAAFFWAFQGRALKSHFGPDEMMNLYGYWHPALWKVILANLTFWSDFVRPMAAVYYLPMFHLFGLNPVPYTWIRIGVLAVNTALFYKLALRLSRSWWVAALAAFPIAYHANLGNLSFDGAFIFDSLCATFYFAALLYYVRKRAGATHLGIGQGCVFLALYICALDTKEMAVSLPVMVLAYELLLRKPASGIRELARQLWPTLASGAVTVIFILGKTLSPGSLTNQEAYRPVLTWARFADSTTRFINTIFYTDVLTMEHAAVLWALLLCAGIAGLLRRRRDGRWLFLWIWVTVTPLPIVFLPGRGFGLLYLVAAGWALAAAMLCQAVSWRLTRELFAGRPARLAVMGLLFLGYASGYAYETRILHRYMVYGYLLLGKDMAHSIAQFKALGLQPKSGSQILFLNDPFGGRYDMTFLAALTWNDHSLRIYQQVHDHFTPEQIAAMDYILDYADDQYVVRKTR